jgi:hypothetical protein
MSASLPTTNTSTAFRTWQHQGTGSGPTHYSVTFSRGRSSDDMKCEGPQAWVSENVSLRQLLGGSVQANSRQTIRMGSFDHSHPNIRGTQMNTNPERLSNLVRVSRNYIESWAIVWYAIAGLELNADFDCFRDDFDTTSCYERRQSLILDRGAPIQDAGIMLTLAAGDLAADPDQGAPALEPVHPIRKVG